MSELIETVAAHPIASTAVGVFTLIALVFLVLFLEGVVVNLCQVLKAKKGGQ